MPDLFSDAARVRAARRLFEALGEALRVPVGVRLWDGSVVPLGEEPEPALQLEIAGPGALGSLLRRPTAANLLRLWAAGQLDHRGGELYDLVAAIKQGGRSGGTGLTAGRLWRALPLLLTPSSAVSVRHTFGGDTRDQGAPGESARSRIAFHYDVPSEFFGLFLGPQMQYSSAYYADAGASLEQAQEEKLDRICRKLELEKGDRLLDVGCGWGGLVCHAARHYGVRAHGITLSREQLAHGRERVAAAGLEDRVELEIRHWTELDGGVWDKIASIEMCEHVGVARLPAYFAKLRGCLRDGGALVLQATARRAKGRPGRGRPSRDTRLLQKYLLPGIEVIEIGSTTHVMERAGFEIHQVEGLRRHYALTAREWARRIWQRRQDAVRLAGEEAYRLWLVLLTGLALTYGDGSNQVFQVLASRYRKQLWPPAGLRQGGAAAAPGAEPDPGSVISGA